MITKNIYNKVLGLAVAALTLVACTDTWDDHYNGASTGVMEGSLWDAIQKDANLSNFASVVQACGYDKSLASSQVFTVFAPTNDAFTKEEADALIASYNQQKGKVNDEENTTIKEFLQNHIALYNFSTSSKSNDSIVLMNGKYAILKSGQIDNTPLTSTNKLYGNGVLFTVGSKVNYFANVFEYLRKDNALDSVANFFYNSMFYRREFQPEKSVEGGIVDGKTIYLDSVFVQQNDLFDSEFLRARLNSEDSVYWMVVPTNEVWANLVDEYKEYFNYDNNVEDRDSLHYTNTRMAIVKGTAFSRTLNTDKMLQDSAMSTNAVTNFTARRYTWGADSLHYFQYFYPLQAGGIFSGTTEVECSNGKVMKSSDWPFDKRETFFQTRIIEAESQGAIQTVSKVERVQGSDTLQVETITPQSRYVTSDNAFYNTVSNNGFVEFEPAITTVNHSVTFNITDVLSNIGYDIYLVTAPALANDSNATAIQRLPTVVRCTLGFHNQQGVAQTDQVVSSYTTNPDVVDYIKIAEDYKFPVCSYGLKEENAQVTLKVETRVSSTQQRNNTHTRTMRIDCIILKPHEE